MKPEKLKLYSDLCFMLFVGKNVLKPQILVGKNVSKPQRLVKKSVVNCQILVGKSVLRHENFLDIMHFLPKQY